jgi:PBP1b-binding outer membrane lipoprotein LpoB
MKNLIKLILGAMLIVSCSGNNGNKCSIYPNFAHSIVYNEDSTQF